MTAVAEAVSPQVASGADLRAVEKWAQVSTLDIARPVGRVCALVRVAAERGADRRAEIGRLGIRLEQVSAELREAQAAIGREQEHRATLQRRLGVKEQELTDVYLAIATRDQSLIAARIAKTELEAQLAEMRNDLVDAREAALGVVPQAHRRSSTSQQGAMDVAPRAGTQRYKLLAAYREWGPMIPDEARRRAGLGDKSAYWVRNSELAAGGFLEPTEVTRRGEAGSAQAEHRITARGLAVLS